MRLKIKYSTIYIHSCYYKAKKQPIEFLTPESLDVKIAPDYNTLTVEDSSKRKAGIMVENVDQLIEKLKNEAKVIN